MKSLKIMILLTILFVVVDSAFGMGARRTTQPKLSSKVSSKNQILEPPKTSTRRKDDSSEESFFQKMKEEYFWPKENMTYEEKHEFIVNKETWKKDRQHAIAFYGSEEAERDHKIRELEVREWKKIEDPLSYIIWKNHCPFCKRLAEGTVYLP